MRKLNRDTVVAIFLLLFCGVFFAASLRVEETTYATIGAEVWPQLIIAALFVLSAVYLLQSVRQPPRSPDQTPRQGFLVRYRNAIWCYGLFLAFLLTLEVFGMLLGGILFVFLALSALGERSPRRIVIHAALAVVSVGAMWAIFTYALRVILPQGMLPSVW